MGERGKERKAYRAVDDLVIPCVVVDVDRDAAQGGDLGGELVEARVVLSGCEGCAGQWVRVRDGVGRGEYRSRS